MKGIKSFNLKNALASAGALAIGGGANILADWALNQFEATASWDKKYINGGKIAIGAIISSMLDGKKYGMLKSAADGIAIVGASNLADELINGTDETTATTTGLPEGTIGRLRMGQRGFRRGRVAGIKGASFMEA